ncbi:hypothetical protein [Candidatus Thiodubiliella endoseptemdiera]|uniref:hypothetical protein n=1 Tax=Candidatus Thiodubiliella endoseptemdiera TaxID=2738886 RepID=UPI0034DF31EF
MNNHSEEATDRPQTLRELIIKRDVDIEFNIRVIDRAIAFLESSLSVKDWLDSEVKNNGNHSNH